MFNVEEVGSCLQVTLMREEGNYYERSRSGKKQKSRIIKRMQRQRNGLYVLKSKEDVSV